MYDYWLIGAIVVMFIGVLGTFLPVIPGISLIFLAMVGYGFAEGFQKMTPLFLGLNLIAVLLSSGFDYLGTAWGARRFGASSSGTWGAVAGGLLGLPLGPFGAVAGAFIGAVAGELWHGRSIETALEAGVGTVLGLAGASALRFLLAMVMIIAFIWQVW
ncbi:conserved hypothetical protein duf456 [Heliomicrobium modesticaldum Ice1]|uniref:DUF456 domain-containing protein n=1 Tax=Heliobacterium modesticaldum (strain ATCC 51547 / Ice1) TaxID=498761 RepID=B0TAZ7_HELMI|nr:DUF456 domain-containing protein [Heliomicrobium modesticaldum]ABZ85108.1 conserved hypothetical protein duf456 [Heliomicrobium modesticaldum Ice1]